jgi:hypothetical protein
LEPVLRCCERGGNGQKQACCLFWTMGGNQVGEAALIACSPDYVLPRPVLIELKRRYPEG